jgi:hypothetical protein
MAEAGRIRARGIIDDREKCGMDEMVFQRNRRGFLLVFGVE